jgi:uncharacterized protein RhaS with RHS repeats
LYDPQTGRFLTQDPIGLAGGVNLYAYAGNNPTAFRDPFGLTPDTIEVRWHEVLGSGKSHASVRITPNDQDAWKDDPRFEGEPGKKSITLSAAPHTCQGSGVCLVSDPNRSSDIAQQDGSVLVDIGGRDENEVIRMLLQADADFTDDLGYEPYGSTWGRYNSNSFVPSLLWRAYLVPPAVPAALPGYEHPFPIMFK